MPLLKCKNITARGTSEQTYYLPNEPIKLQLESKTESMDIDLANMSDPYQEIYIGSSVFSWNITDVRVTLTKIRELPTPVREWRNDYRVKVYEGDTLVQDTREVRFRKDEYIKINGIMIDIDAMHVAESITVRFFNGQGVNKGIKAGEIIGNKNIITIRSPLSC